MKITIEGDAKEIAALLAVPSERRIESKEFLEAVLKIAKDEDDRRGWALLESTCPPEFVKALRQEFDGSKHSED